MKGQAFIVFKDLPQASEAMRGLQRFKFFGKELDVRYAKGKSEVIAKRDGTFNKMMKKRAKKKAGIEMEDMKKKEKKEEVAVEAPTVKARLYILD